MSAVKQYAVRLIESMPEEKVIAFINLISDRNTIARIETEELISDLQRKTYNSFGEFMSEMERETSDEI